MTPRSKLPLFLCLEIVELLIISSTVSKKRSQSTHPDCLPVSLKMPTDDDFALPDDPKDFPVPPRSGSLRWGNHERKLLNRLIEKHRLDATHEYALDPKRVGDTTYLSTHWQRWPLFERHPRKNFYQNVRRAVNEWEVDQSLKGARRAQNIEDNKAEEDNDNEAEEVNEAEEDNEDKVEEEQESKSEEGSDGGTQEEQESEEASVETVNYTQGKNSDMPEWYHWEWKETILPGSRNTPMNRVTLEVLLYGPTHRSQLSIHIVGDRRVRIEFSPHSVFYNARRTALRTRSDLSSVRIMAQDEAIGKMIADNDHRPLLREWIMDLDVDVDPNFTTRDDNGNEGVSDPITIGEFIHDDEQFRKDGKTVWILTIEMTAARRTHGTPSRAQGIDFSQFDPNAINLFGGNGGGGGPLGGYNLPVAGRGGATPSWVGSSTATGGWAPPTHSAPPHGGQSGWNPTTNTSGSGVTWGPTTTFPSVPAPSSSGGTWVHGANGWLWTTTLAPPAPAPATTPAGGAWVQAPDGSWAWQTTSTPSTSGSGTLASGHSSAGTWSQAPDGSWIWTAQPTPSTQSVPHHHQHGGPTPAQNFGAPAPPSQHFGGTGPPPPPQNSAAPAPPPQNFGAPAPPPQNSGGTVPPPQNSGGTGPPPQNFGAPAPPPQNSGGTGTPPQNFGAPAPPPQNAGETGPPPQNFRGTGPPPQNFRGTGLPPQNFRGTTGPPDQNTGGMTGPPDQNAGGMTGPPDQNAGGTGPPPQNFGGTGLPPQNFGVPPPPPPNRPNASPANAGAPAGSSFGHGFRSPQPAPFNQGGQPGGGDSTAHSQGRGSPFSTQGGASPETSYHGGSPGSHGGFSSPASSVAGGRTGGSRRSGGGIPPPPAYNTRSRGGSTGGFHSIPEYY